MSEVVCACPSPSGHSIDPGRTSDPCRNAMGRRTWVDEALREVIREARTGLPTSSLPELLNHLKVQVAEVSRLSLLGCPIVNTTDTRVFLSPFLRQFLGALPRELSPPIMVSVQGLDGFLLLPFPVMRPLAAAVLRQPATAFAGALDFPFHRDCALRVISRNLSKTSHLDAIPSLPIFQ